MYNFIFYFFYTNFKRFKNKKDREIKWNACAFLLVFLLMHLAFLGSIIRSIFSIKATWHFHGVGLQIYGLLFFALLGSGIFKYYTPERISQIEQKYLEVKILTFKNSVLIILLFFVPLIISIVLTNVTLFGSVIYHGN